MTSYNKKRYGQVPRFLWEEPAFLALSPGARTFLVYLRTCPASDGGVSVAGIFRFIDGDAEEHLGVERVTVAAHLNEVERGGFVRRSGKWLWIVNVIEDVSNLRSPKIQAAIEARLGDVPEDLRAAFLERYHELLANLPDDEVPPVPPQNKNKNKNKTVSHTVSDTVSHTVSDAQAAEAVGFLVTNAWKGQEARFRARRKALDRARALLQAGVPLDDLKAAVRAAGADAWLREKGLHRDFAHVWKDEAKVSVLAAAEGDNRNRSGPQLTDEQRAARDRLNKATDEQHVLNAARTTKAAGVDVGALPAMDGTGR